MGRKLDFDKISDSFGLFISSLGKGYQANMLDKAQGTLLNHKKLPPGKHFNFLALTLWIELFFERTMKTCEI